jgi:uncharacterized protein YkwD
LEPDDVLGLLGCGYAPTALTDGGHRPAPPPARSSLKDVRRPADNHQVERRRPDGPQARARTSSLLGVALACLALAGPALGVASRHRATRASALDDAIVSQVNAVRARAGLRPLRENAELATAARAHSSEMASLGYFSHESANGESMASRVRDSYPATSRWTVGENLLWSSPRIGGRRAVDLWMASPEHRSIMLTAGWHDVGCAAVHRQTAPGIFAGLPVTVVTCDFGVRS